MRSFLLFVMVILVACAFVFNGMVESKGDHLDNVMKIVSKKTGLNYIGVVRLTSNNTNDCVMKAAGLDPTLDNWMFFVQHDEESKTDIYKMEVYENGKTINEFLFGLK